MAQLSLFPHNYSLGKNILDPAVVDRPVPVDDMIDYGAWWLILMEFLMGFCFDAWQAARTKSAKLEWMGENEGA